MAIRDLLTRGVKESAAELEQMAEQIPRSLQRRFEPCDRHFEVLASKEDAEGRIKTAEQQRIGTCVRTALCRALRKLSRQERQLIGLRFGRGWTVRRIAAKLNLEERPLYRRFKRILRELRDHLEEVGLSWSEIATTFDGRDFDLDLDLR